MHRSTVEDLGGGVLNRAGRLSRPTRERLPRSTVPTLVVVVVLASATLVACAPGDARSPAATDRPAAAEGTADLPSSAETSASAAREDYARELVELVNDERSGAGLAPLTLSTCAVEQASGRAARLASDGGPLVHAPLEPVTDACPPASMSGENLSRASAPPADVVDAWMGSPGHRSNILAPGFTQTGVACSDAAAPAGGGLLCSQVFLGP